MTRPGAPPAVPRDVAERLRGHAEFEIDAENRPPARDAPRASQDYFAAIMDQSTLPRRPFERSQ
jgi:hypothetical protein